MDAQCEEPKKEEVEKRMESNGEAAGGEPRASLTEKGRGDLPELTQLREKINYYDREIIKLLNERMKVCQDIGKAKGRLLAAKKEKSDSKNTKQVYRPVREKLVFDKVTRINASTPGPLTATAVKAIYSEVMSCSINLQQPTTIGYLGPKASYSHQAATNRFGASMLYVAYEDPEKILESVEKGEISYGVMPVENSHEGAESNTLDVLQKSMMKIYAEIEIPVVYNLLSDSKKPEHIETIFGSKVLLARCSKWIRSHLPGAKVVKCHSTEEACKMVSKSNNSVAVGTQLAGDMFGLSVLSASIQDKPTTSRFFVISQVCEPPSGEDKTFVMFSLKDSKGALYRVLQAFDTENVNLSNIESRPSGSRAW
eukprot:CAMPEP_0197533448 /NCGR_PEP_ID=MMETSP1318-20131121/43561_1 /TAXON_ID=552666 /ORGANISM="Partenskyella glossopodia, Strain RCC365" /LENGTH=367 /DNA_ID=CAMNT_0043090355 /DNA_START=47 /DNA_END=1147 /DNA_ORIENTATION=+